jgi:hypothetical protein
MPATRNSGGDEQKTHRRDKQASHSACSARASPHLQAGVDRFDRFHVVSAHDTGLAPTWPSSAVARPLTEELRLESPLVCTDAESEGVRGFVNLIARLLSGTHAISFPLFVVIDLLAGRARRRRLPLESMNLL